MATVTFRGGSAESAYSLTLIVSGYGTGVGSLGVSIGGKTVSAAVASGMTAADYAAALAAALAGSTVPEFQDVSWSYATGSNVVTGAGVTPGLTVTIGAAGGTLVGTLPIPFNQGPGDTSAGISVQRYEVQATGPNHLIAANMDTGALPTGGDTLAFAPGAPPLLYQLDALSAVSLAAVDVPAGYAGPVGLPANHSTGTGTTYPEYRTRYLTLGGNPAVSVGAGDGPGVGRFLLSAGTGSATLTVYGTAARLTSDVPAVNWVNTGSANVLYVAGGDVGLAAEAGQTARVASVGTPAGANTGLTPALFPTGATPAVTTPRLTAGAGATFDTTDVDGGTVDAYGATTALTLTGGVWTQWAGTLGSVVCDGGTVRIRAGGLTGGSAVTSAVFRGPDAVCDLSGDPRAVTFTDGEFTAGAVLRDPNRRLVTTNAMTVDTASMQEMDHGSRPFGLKFS